MKEEEILFNLKKERITIQKRLSKLDAAIKAFEESDIKTIRKSTGKLTNCKHCGKEFICYKVYKTGNYCSTEHRPSFVEKMKQKSPVDTKSKGTILIPSADRR